MKVLVVICVAFCACSAQYIPPNPCPELFKYIKKDGMLYGEIQFENDQSGVYMLSVNMSIGAVLDDDENRLQLELMTSPGDLLRGEPLTYNVYFPIKRVVPRPTEILFNGIIYCRGPFDKSTTTNLWSSISSAFSVSKTHEVSTFTFPSRNSEGLQLNSSGTPSLTFPPEWIDDLIKDSWFTRSTTPTISFPRPTTPSTKPTAPSTRPTTPSTKPTAPSTRPTTPSTKATTSTTGSLENEEECGVSFMKYLIVGGDIVEEGQFPWMVAIMYWKRSAYTYGCSGSLISKKHIVSAGHCVLNSRGPLVPFTDILLVLGRVNIEHWVRKAVVRGVKDVVAHPDYNYNRGYADIAVLSMDEPVQYEEGIRPICLWKDNDDLNGIVGRVGTVAGWGEDESGKEFTNNARKINMRVVSQEDCIKTNDGLKRLSSDKTFCGGRRDATGPCTGDSGAGFVMSQKGRWFLRGVVSSSVDDGLECNLEDYFIFTDAAKVVGWLQSVIAS